MKMRTFLVATLVATAAIAAEPKAMKPLAESLSGSAKVAYDAGKLLFTDGDFAGASLKFRQAYEQSHDPRLLWNMAAAEKSLRHYAKAADLTRRYLSDAKAFIGREQKENAEETLNAMLGFLGELVVSPEPVDALVSIDGEARTETGRSRTFTVDQGTRTVRVEKESFDPFVKAVEVVGGARVTVPAVLVRLAITGKLAVIANDGAAIEVDGQAVGTSRWGGELLPGPHAVRVTLAGKKPHQASVDVTARSLRTVEVALEDEAPLAPIAAAPESSTHWGWWVAGAVAAGAAATVAYVLLAPTSAQGTRDPGTLGAVNLPLVAW